MFRSKKQQSSKRKNRAVKKPVSDVRDEGERRMFSMEELKVFAEERGMPITQANGQRIYGPPLAGNLPPPENGCEVFVGKLPRDVFEPTLVPLFESIGPIYELRMMMAFSGANRGYCFILYANREDAERAVVELNEYEIYKGRKIGVLKSVDNRRLYLEGIPKEKTVPEIFDRVSKVSTGVKTVWGFSSTSPTRYYADAADNRGYAFVEYFNHRMAAMARKKMINGIVLWDSVVIADWADPDFEFSKFPA